MTRFLPYAAVFLAALCTRAGADPTLYLGFDPGSDEQYVLSSGTLSTYRSYVGHSGRGTFHHVGGDHTVQTELYVGYNNGSEGIYNLSDGTLTADEAAVGRGGDAEFHQTGGAVHVAADQHTEFTIGYRSTSQGTYRLSGDGTLTVTTDRTGSVTWAYLARAGRGTFIQEGGTVSIAGYDRWARLYMGHESGSHASYELSDGRLLVQALRSSPTQHQTVGEATEYVGYAGTAEFTQRGGEHTVAAFGDADVFVGYETGASGTYALHGGDFTIASDTTRGSLHVGYGNGAQGEYVQSGGHLQVGGDLVFGELGGVGVCRLSGGTGDVAGHFDLRSATGYVTTADTPAGEAGARLNVGGSFSNGSMDAAANDLRRLILALCGGRAVADSQVFCQPWTEDRGACLAGLDDNYALGLLVVGDGEGAADNHVRLTSDLYTYGLNILADGVVDLDGHTIYYVPDGLEYDGIPGAGFACAGSYLNGQVVPIPEPASAAMLILGALGLMARRAGRREDRRLP